MTNPTAEQIRADLMRRDGSAERVAEAFDAWYRLTIAGERGHWAAMEDLDAAWRHVLQAREDWVNAS
jgi:hypothetical protein